jgi:hypothetical protein
MFRETAEMLLELMEMALWPAEIFVQLRNLQF